MIEGNRACSLYDIYHIGQLLCFLSCQKTKTHVPVHNSVTIVCIMYTSIPNKPICPYNRHPCRLSNRIQPWLRGCMCPTGRPLGSQKAGIKFRPTADEILFLLDDYRVPGRVCLLLSSSSSYGSPLLPSGDVAIGYIPPCHIQRMAMGLGISGCTNENSDHDPVTPPGKQWYGVLRTC